MKKGPFWNPLLKASWELLGLSWEGLGPLLGALGPSWAPLYFQNGAQEGGTIGDEKVCYCILPLFFLFFRSGAKECEEKSKMGNKTFLSQRYSPSWDPFWRPKGTQERPKTLPREAQEGPREVQKWAPKGTSL